MTCEYEKYPLPTISVVETARRAQLLKNTKKPADESYQDGAAAVLKECAELLERKSQDYNSNGINRDDYYLYGRKSLMTMIHTKTLRLRSLIDQTDTEPNFESIQDTLKDLANYSAIWIDWERRNADR